MSQNRWALVALFALAAAAAGEPALGWYLAPRPDFSEVIDRPRPPPLDFEEIHLADRRLWGAVIPNKARPPIIIAVPGHPGIAEGGRYATSWLPSYLHHEGFALGYVGYHKRERVDAKTFAADMAKGIAEIVGRASKYGFDPSRVVLMGSAWGGHLAALLGTDPTYLTQASVPFESLRAVVIFDGSGFDLPATIAAASEYKRKQLVRLAGSDVEAQRRISPVAYAAAPNAPYFLFYDIESEPPQPAAEAFVSDLRTSGSTVEIRRVGASQWKWPGTYIGSDQSSENEGLRRFLIEATK